jgi:hypothetical protein
MLIYAKLRQFQRKLAGGPGWIRFPSPAPVFTKEFEVFSQHGKVVTK